MSNHLMMTETKPDNTGVLAKSRWRACESPERSRRMPGCLRSAGERATAAACPKCVALIEEATK